MKKFAVDIVRVTNKGREHICRMEIEIPRFTSRTFKMITCMLFDFAADSIDNNHLVATVNGDGLTLFSISAETSEDGSSIWTNISIARPCEDQTYIRRMVVAA